jgi:hypothetical protein
VAHKIDIVNPATELKFPVDISVRGKKGTDMSKKK